MRLYPDEQQVLLELLPTIPGEVYLFGSRVDDLKTGGDIDLLILSANFTPAQAAQLSYQFYNRLESKLDVLLLNPQQLTADQQAFLNTLQKVKLN